MSLISDYRFEKEKLSLFVNKAFPWILNVNEMQVTQKKSIYIKRQTIYICIVEDWQWKWLERDVNFDVFTYKIDR